MTILAIDTLGGDHPDELLAAVAAASTRRTDDAPVYFSLVGDERELAQKLSTLSHNPERINVVHASDIITMADPPQWAIDARPRNPVTLGAELVALGHADALISAGNPGLAVLSARRHFTLLDGVKRAALCSVYPTPERRTPGEDPFSLLLDVGASVSASPEDLVDFAQMGAAYARVVGKKELPRVALLSNSREPAVGPRHIGQAHALLSELAGERFVFLGCIEGHDIPRGKADVIVCDGFVGDVTIKLLEGVGEAAVEIAQSAYERKFMYRQGLRLLSGGLQKIQRLLDYEEYGGAPLLGFAQLMILAHPRSRRRAFENAIKLAIRNVRHGLTAELAAAVK